MVLVTGVPILDDTGRSGGWGVGRGTCTTHAIMVPEAELKVVCRQTGTILTPSLTLATGTETRLSPLVPLSLSRHGIVCVRHLASLGPPVEVIW